MTVYNAGEIYLEDLSGGTSDQIHIYAQTDNIADGAVTDAKLAQTGGVLSTINGMQPIVDVLGEASNVDMPEMTYIEGYFINGTNNTITSNVSFKYSEPFYVEAGNILLVKTAGYQNVVGVIAETTEDASSYITLVRSDGDQYQWYEYAVKVNGWFSVCSHIDYAPIVATVHDTHNEISELVDRIEVVEEDLNIYAVETTYTNNYFIDSRKNSAVQSANHMISDPFFVDANSTIFVKAKGYLNFVAIIAKTDETGGSYQTKVASDGNDYKLYSYTTEDAGYFCISCDKGSAYKPEIHVANHGDTSGLGTGPLATIIHDGGYLPIFHTLGCIGDSLTSGTMNYPTGDTYGQLTDPEYSWPKILARQLGITAYNFSRGGATTRLWLRWYQEADYLFDDFATHPCTGYVISLGVNDRYYQSIGSELGVPLGTSADVDLTDPAQNADTFYGNYARIISVVKVIQEHAKIFVVTDPIANDYNDAIRWMAANFDNVYLIDLYTYGHELYTALWNDGGSRVSSHLTAIGYQQSAWHIGTYIDYIISNNMNDFKYVQFIGTEHYPA